MTLTKPQVVQYAQAYIKLAHDIALHRWRVGIVASLVVSRAPVLRGDGETSCWRRREPGLGRYPDVSLKAARLQALENLPRGCSG